MWLQGGSGSGIFLRFKFEVFHNIFRHDGQEGMAEKVVIGGSTTEVIGADIAMTLSSIAYCKDIKAAIQKYLPDWELAWLPAAEIGGNLAFIAYNGVQYVVAIRGSVLNFSWDAFDDWFKEDFNVFEQVDWIYPPNPETKPKISKGSSDGLANLCTLQDSQGETILSYLMKYCVDQGKFLCVTGHSLGGNLSTVLAPWLLYQIRQAQKEIPSLFSVLTFAAPSAGNTAFAEQHDASFTNCWRFYNALNIVPFCSSDIAGIGELFPSPGPSAKSIDIVGKAVTPADAFKDVAKALAQRGSIYTQTNINPGSEPLNLNKEIFPVTSDKPLPEWFEQTGAQHNYNKYQTWLGAGTVEGD